MKGIAKGLKCVQLGSIGVDAGLCWIGDPCYVLHKEKGEKPKAIGKNWGEFCDIINTPEGREAKSFTYDMGHEGLGVCLSTGYGDGCYPVYGFKNKEGRIMQVLIDFTGSEAMFNKLIGRTSKKKKK